MFIAKVEEFQHIVRGSQVGSRTVVQSTLTCPSCGRNVNFDPSPHDVFHYFEHEDGSPDCFINDATSAEHRLAVEVSVQSIYNRLVETTGGPIEIDTGRWVGEQPNFISADVRVTAPLRVTAEIFYKAGDFALKRRFKTLAKHDYRTFLILHTEGTHDPELINRYMARVTSLNVGHFNPHTMDIVLGDLFSQDQINFSAGKHVPNYLIHTG